MAAKKLDPTLKVLVEASPDEWPILTDLPPGPTEVIDADIATVSAAADKVLRVHAPQPYLLHLEFHSGHDGATLPPLVHLRNTLLRARHRLMVWSVVFVLRREADARALTGNYVEAFPPRGVQLQFNYQVVRLWQMSSQRLLESGLAGLLLAPLSDVTTAELPGIMEQMKSRLGRRDVSNQAGELWGAEEILLGLRYSDEIIRQLLQGVTGMKESVTYQRILREGRDEGLQQGACAEARKIILRQGRKRFGEPDERIAATLEGITGLARLEELTDRLLEVGSWQELLPTRARRRKSDA